MRDALGYPISVGDTVVWPVWKVFSAVLAHGTVVDVNEEGDHGLGKEPAFLVVDHEQRYIELHNLKQLVVVP